MERFDRKTSEVDILITAPSDNEEFRSDSSDEDEEEDEIYDDDGEHSGTLSDNSESYESFEKSEKSEDRNDESGGTRDEKKLREEFENSMNLSEEKPPREEKDTNSSNGEQNYEIVGDRVLVEKDGKFELVDASEIKAEYFQMIGVKNEDDAKVDQNEDKTDSSTDKSESLKERPKTTPARASRSKEANQRPKRVQSSWGERYKNTEYSNIRSQYGLSEKQLEIKRKREEAIAKRKKEEEERAREEEKRKREDAERAFQVCSVQSRAAVR